jgi:hypothetical protein
MLNVCCCCRHAYTVYRMFQFLLSAPYHEEEDE